MLPPLPIPGLPNCPRCQDGVLLPLSDTDGGASLAYTAWVCTRPGCGYSVRIRRQGEVVRNEPVHGRERPAPGDRRGNRNRAPRRGGAADPPA
jgi:hypothetical protein